MNRRRGRGQSLVEFALVLPVFLLMLLGLFDIGRLVYLNSTLSQAAREGARLASVEASWLGSTDPSCNTAGGPVCPADEGELRSHIEAAVNRMIAPFATIPDSDIFIDCSYSPPSTATWTTPNTCASPYSGATVSVRVIADFNAITPVIGQIVGTVPTSGSATMVNN